MTAILRSLLVGFKSVLDLPGGVLRPAGLQKETICFGFDLRTFGQLQYAVSCTRKKGVEVVPV